MYWIAPRSLLLLVLILAGVQWAYAAVPEDRIPRVLIVYPYDERLPATMVGGEAARKRLLEATNGKIILFSEFLDLSRFPEKDHAESMARFLASKYRPTPPDIIIALGPEALAFMAAHRAEIAPDARIIFCGIGRAEVAALKLPDDVVGAFTDFGINRTLDLALHLQPGAREVVVIAGSSAFDKSWISTARSDLAIPANVKVTYLTDMPLDDIVRRTASLPPNSIILFLSFFTDSNGQNFISRDVLQKIAPTSGAPVYGPYSTYFGEGIVGGSIVTFESMGEAAAQLAVDTLQARPVTNVTVPHTLVADARQLHRWGLRESSLPPGTVVSYKEKSLWEEHRTEIIAIFAVIALQCLVIGALLVERTRRRAAEVQSRRRLLEVIHLNQSATAGALSASIAHELNQPLGAIRNNAEAAALILSADAPNLEIVRQILDDIRDDDQRASDIIQRLRGLLKKRREIEWQQFDVREVVDSALHILHGEAQRRSVLVDCVQTPERLPVRADRVHIQQVILNIATNAMDAMPSSASAQRKLVLITDISDGSKAAVTISDTGTGIPDDQLGRIFETFYTTKASGTGLGLSIARTIVETYGGGIWAANRPEGGAVVGFHLPLIQA